MVATNNKGIYTDFPEQDLAKEHFVEPETNLSHFKSPSGVPNTQEENGREQPSGSNKDPLDSYKDFVERMNKYFPSTIGTSGQTQDAFTDGQILEVSQLLQMTNKSWSLVPRLYIVLRHLGQLPALDVFIAQGMNDYWFPFTIRSLPQFLSPVLRQKFLEIQWIVLTKGSHLEKGEDGAHQNFGPNEALPFLAKEGLGIGAFGVVDRVVFGGGIEYVRKRMRRDNRPGRTKGCFDDFVKELQVLKRVRHHHAVEIIGSYTDPNFLALIMSPVADCNLAEFLQQSQTEISRRPALRSFFGCLLSGLAYIHSIQIRHRDIKPVNILVKGENVLYTDFGLAHDWHEYGVSTTRDSMPLMTKRYSAPEMLMDGARNSLSDVWSLGCVFLEILTVLNGKTLDDMRSFFEFTGTASIIYACNPDAVRGWVLLLERAARVGNDQTPIAWTERMFQSSSKARPTAAILFQEAKKQRSGPSSNTYCGSCCRIEDDDDLKPVALPIRASASPNSEMQGSERGVKSVAKINNDSEFLGSLPESSASHSIGKNREATMPDQHSLPLRSEKTITSGVRSIFRTVDLKIENRPFNMSTSPQGPAYIEANTEVLKLASIFAALRARDCSRIFELVEKGDIDLDAENAFGDSVLSMAVLTQDPAIVEILLRGGANPDTTDQQQRTALYIAALQGWEAILKVLLRYGANPNLGCSDNITPLHAAARHDHNACARHLVEAGAALDTQFCPDTEGLTALHIVAQYGNTSLSQYLLQNKANVHIKEKRGRTALHQAAQAGHTEIVELLLDHGASINQITDNLETPLVLACHDGYAATVRFLLEQGADYTIRLREGRCVVHAAAEFGYLETLRILLDAGVPADMRDDVGMTALPLCVKKATQDHSACVRLLLEKGTNINSCTKYGATALHQAAMSGHPSMIQLLLDNGADPNYRARVAESEDGYTPLHLVAATNGDPESTRILIENGADKSAITGKWNVLGMAVSKGHEKMAEVILKASGAPRAEVFYRSAEANKRLLRT